VSSTELLPMIPAIAAATASPTGSEGTRSTVEFTNQGTGSSVTEPGIGRRSEADLYEILADDVSRHVQSALSGRVAALYPQLA
jgi:hypothetical protein